MDASTNMNQKRIIFYSLEAIGHINPFISIAKELRARGHYVCFVTARELMFKDTYKDTGLEFYHCINEDKNDARDDSGIAHLMEIFRKGPRFAFSSVYKVNSGIGKKLDDLVENHNTIENKLRQLKPDVIVFDSIHGIPCVTYVAPKWVRLFSAFPTILYSNLNEGVVAGLGLTREEMLDPANKQFEIETKAYIVDYIKKIFTDKGLEPWQGQIEISPSSPHLNFCLGPNELSLDEDPRVKQPLDKTWIRLEHTIDEPDSADRFEIPEKLANLPGKLVYFSLGTLVTNDSEMINRLLTILSKSPHRFIISMGRKHEEVKLFDNMWGQKYVDQKAILQKVDLFITHGGHNSIIEAFYYGVPGLIVLPVFADQFDLAQRVQDCGFGLRLSPYDCQETELLQAIANITTNDDLAKSMKSISSRLRTIDYHKIAASHIESLLI